MVNLHIEWAWMLAGFVVGIVCSWFVSDLVFPVGEKTNDEER
jgi:hypothetical protein